MEVREHKAMVVSMEFSTDSLGSPHFKTIAL